MTHESKAVTSQVVPDLHPLEDAELNSASGGILAVLIALLLPDPRK